MQGVNYLAIAVAVCLAAALFALICLIPHDDPSSFVSLSILFSFTMNIPSSNPWGALPRNYTPFTDVSEHLSHLSQRVVNI